MQSKDEKGGFLFILFYGRDLEYGGTGGRILMLGIIWRN